MCKVKMHFEQVPVELVKKIALDEQEENREQESDGKETRSLNLSVETAGTKTGPYSVNNRMNRRDRA